MTPRPAAKLDIALAALLAISGYAVAAFKLAALSWDGSWYLFRSLQDGAPFIPHLRYATYPILWLIVGAARVVHDPRTLGVYYGLLLALFPLGSLALSWYFLRAENHRPLRIWPTLGILLAPLPGQFCLMSEATPAAQLLWPIMAIIAVGPPGVGGSFWLALLCAELFCLHPTAALILALAAALCGWQTWTLPRTKTSAWIWTSIFAVLAAGKLILTLFSATDYERSQVSGKEMLIQLGDSTLGLPLLLLVLTYLFGFVTLAASISTAHPKLSRKSTITLYAVLLIFIAALGLAWAADPMKWRGLLNYRRFVLPATLPLVGMAIWHYRSLALTPRFSRQPNSLLLSGVSAVFAGVLITQSFVWSSLLGRFTQALSGSPARSPFVYADDLAFTRHTALQHWTACPLSILLQGREPRAVFVLKPEDIHPGYVQVNFWEQIPLTNHWFTLQPLAARHPNAP